MRSRNFPTSVPITVVEMVMGMLRAAKEQDVTEAVGQEVEGML